MGNGKMVMLFKPEDIQTMYSSDGRIPMLPGFDNFEYSRNVSMKDRFPSAGLISNKVKKFCLFILQIFLKCRPLIKGKIHILLLHDILPDAYQIDFSDQTFFHNLHTCVYSVLSLEHCVSKYVYEVVFYL